MFVSQSALVKGSMQMQGLAKARDVGLLSWQSTPCTWNLAEYEFYEQVENGDLNWIIPGQTCLQASAIPTSQSLLCQAT